MPHARTGDALIAWRWGGAGPPPDPARADVVVLVMGLSGSGRLWWRLEPHLADRHLLVLDNRGTGDSSAVRGPLTMDTMARDALAVLDAAGVPSAHVVGASMGGMIAQHLALDHRDRVRSAVLACTTPGGGNAGPPPWRLLVTSALRPVLGPRRTFAIVAPALYAPRTLREHRDRAREDLRRRVEDATPARTTYAQIAAIARHDTRARLHELAGLPVTVVHGADDALVPAERGEQLARGIPGARLVVISDCGHMLTTDAEHETARAIRDHLAFAVARAQAPSQVV